MPSATHATITAPPSALIHSTCHVTIAMIPTSVATPRRRSTSSRCGVRRVPSPLVALPAERATKDAALIKLISKKAKAPADAFTLAAYDALNVSAQALVAAGKNPDNAALQSAFTTAADGYPGVTGIIELDAAGDRATAPYAFWSICASGSSGTSSGPPKWVRTGLWEPAADPASTAALTSDGCPLT